MSLRLLGFGYWSSSDANCFGAALVCLEGGGCVSVDVVKRKLWMAERLLLFGGNYSRAAKARLEAGDNLEMDMAKVEALTAELLR